MEYAQVEFVEAVQTGEQEWRFAVTVRHNDEGWDHYADAWQVIHPESGEVLGERMLLHPHDTEQPFTRDLRDLMIPASLHSVIVRAKCNVHGFGGREVEVDLANSDGDDRYSIERR